MSHPIRQDGRRRQLLRLPGMHFHFGLSGVILTPFSGQPAQDNRRALIAEARNFAAATLSEGRDNHDMAYFQPALEASEIYLKLRPYLKGAPRKIGASLHRANQIQGSHALSAGGWHGTAWLLRFESTL